MSRDLTEGQLFVIKYTSDTKNETTERTIIPLYVPPTAIRSLDVSSLSQQEQQKTQELVEQYIEYRRIQNAKTFDFATWVEHTTGLAPESLKFRTLKVNNIVVTE